MKRLRTCIPCTNSCVFEWLLTSNERTTLAVARSILECVENEKAWHTSRRRKSVSTSELIGPSVMLMRQSLSIESLVLARAGESSSAGASTRKALWSLMPQLMTSVARLRHAVASDCS